MTDTERTRYLVRARECRGFGMAAERTAAVSQCRRDVLTRPPDEEGEVWGDIYEVHRFTRYMGSDEGFVSPPDEEQVEVGEVLLCVVKRAGDLQPGDELFDGAFYQTVEEVTERYGSMWVTYESGDGMAPPLDKLVAVVPEGE